MSNDAPNANDSANDSNPAKAQQPAESGYGSPSPEDEMPTTAATNPGSADPTLRGQQTDAEALKSDQSLGAHDRNFLDNEDAGSDGEPGAGSLGGTDEQFRDEKDMADPSFAHVDPADETPSEAPSTDAPLDDDNAGPTRPDRESFSSESDEDASGE
ncbi:hypothetical protein CVV68_19190 [Arthrobacter livingstonensis]|uniref:Uncharacterized protein n=1 Tax=Arthrobacter livingstonensis TaxID=670078 RepID=A0A2V5L214_9MICC|nr:hypothetical protein [Arthrobacter livingstonensis]PYI65235.1 hypothetical protein CVV68_19190 [Arthrobacter livingstonensis]